MRRSLMQLWSGVSLCLLLSASQAAAEEPAGTRRLQFLNYPNCIELRNASARVILCPDAGGRVLVYEHSGKNALFLDDAEKDWRPDRQRPLMTAGRFDIGPEKIIPRHPTLWSGRWQGEISAPRTARMVSQKDPATGTQLVRTFVLAKDSTQLRCTQTIKNVSQATTRWCHWSRTFALGNGMCFIPLTPSRFPNSYVMYREGRLIDSAPQDPAIRVRDGFLEITDVPEHPKLGMDSQAGWFAYLMRNDLLFVKTFPVFPDRVYNEVAGLTISIWYPQDRRVELEPIGPQAKLAPGESSSFTEVWWLAPFEFPEENKQVDLSSLTQTVQKLTDLDLD